MRDARQSGRPGAAGAGPAAAERGRRATAPVLKAAAVRGGARRVTVSFTVTRATTVTITVTRSGARRALGTVKVKVKKAGKLTKTISRFGRKGLKAGRYKVVAKVGRTAKSFTVKVR